MGISYAKTQLLVSDWVEIGGIIGNISDHDKTRSWRKDVPTFTEINHESYAKESFAEELDMINTIDKAKHAA